MVAIGSDPEQSARTILRLLREHGEGDYIGESISQLEHCLQCAELASSADADLETVLAALLHDIGQFLPADEAGRIAGSAAVRNMDVTSPSTAKNASAGVATSSSTSVGRVGHETIGALYLAQLGFSDKVCKLVGSHVAAKRYLCAVDGGYYGLLSDASKASLTMQGGPMNEDEVNAWDATGLAEEMCQLRKWDDRAKVVGLQTKNVDDYRDPILQHLSRAGSRG